MKLGRLGKFGHLRSSKFGRFRSLRITCRDRWAGVGLIGVWGEAYRGVAGGRDGTRLREDGAPL